MNWFYLSNNIDHFQQIKRINDEHIDLMFAKIPHTLSTSVLIVYIERAEQLPSTQHGKTLEPYPFCSIKIDNYEEKTTVIKHSTNPSWMKSFMFMLVNPEQSVLQININDFNNKNHLIGTVEILIKNLMEEKDWIINRSYPLKSSFSNANQTKIYIKLQLQIMTKNHPIENQMNLSNESPSNHSIVGKNISTKKSKIHVHLINKNLDQQIVHSRKSSQMKKNTLFQSLFSSCIKKVTINK
jgi:Ca2+-dependent lipid-binding protein